jgi:hypothetical protein
MEDIANWVFSVAALTRDHYDEAGGLIEPHGAACALPTPDRLQLGVALSLHRGGAVENLVDADLLLCKVGAVKGRPVTDPESATL